MAILKDFLEATDYRISEGSEYCWRSYGPDAYHLDYTDNNEMSVAVIFNRKTQRVFEIQAADENFDRQYRWIDPEYREAHDSESREKGFDPSIAFDDVRYIDLEVAADILGKAAAIVRGEEYDKRIQIELELTEAEQFQLMQMAHERDLTLNEMVELILQEVIDRHESTVNKPDDWEFA